TGIASATDGAGSDAFTLISGNAPPGDQSGPVIGLSFVGGSNAVRPDAELRVDLTDPSGILITGHTIQNGVIVTVDENSNTRVDITESFRYSANSYQSGTARFHLPNLAPGPHRISVSAADNLATGINAAQHRARASIDFEVSAQPPLMVQRAFLFPNPARSGGTGGGGQFVVDAPGDPVNVLIHLYTVSGRLIRTLKAFGGQGQIQVPWDGLDAEGVRLANGTYLFMVQVNARDVEGASSPGARAVGEGRFVIVGR
ncbi:MAG TPA: FlgD immunoglobulin-like domain containing protein, partial [Candidatus Eisenbacteria bacterium]|nr:FlgD immunoglobulin-like domain containing protein [Candidatus Eisenbacteria bacterium]